MTSSRLSALDASFLAAETPTAHMHVGWAAVFDPPEEGDRPGFSELRDHIESRLDRAPRYRQRLAFVPLGAHDPTWVDDESFDIGRHVLRAPGASIDAIVADVMSSPLERSRPLWECWIAPRLDDGRIAVVGKVHHCMVDGLAAVELAALLLDAEPGSAASHPTLWRPAQAPDALSRLGRGVFDRLREQLALVARPARLVTAPARIPAAAADVRRAATALVNSFTRPAQPTPSLNPELSPLRHLARLARPMEDIVRVKSHFGTTVNDVVLAACSGAVGRFLENHGEPAIAVKAMVPVTMRAADEAAGLGNRISFLFIDLPSDDPDPVRRLATIHEVTRVRKESGEARGGDIVMSALGYAPPMLQRAVTRMVASPRTFNLVVSNIPGPQGPMWMRGCRLREVYPVVPLAERHALAIGVTSIAGNMFFGLYADRKMLPDVDALAGGIAEELDTLVAACDPPPDPPRGNGRRARTLTAAT